MRPQWDTADVEKLLGGSFSAFCEEFGIVTRSDKQAALEAFARVARVMKGKQ